MNDGTKIFCWVVKGAGLALLLLVLAIAIGEGPPNPFKLSPRELFLMICLLTTLAGIVLALWRQGVGGVMMLAGMVPFAGETHQWLLYAFGLIGILNIICWRLRKKYNIRIVKTAKDA
jgi:hypothetical protein